MASGRSASPRPECADGQPSPKFPCLYRRLADYDWGRCRIICRV